MSKRRPNQPAADALFFEVCASIALVCFVANFTLSGPARLPAVVAAGYLALSAPEFFRAWVAHRQAR